jgi:WXG100 family type VII secretion target
MPDNTDGNIHVQYPHMQNGTDEMNQQTQKIASTLDQLESELGPLKSSWIGNDADVYTQKQHAWHQAVQNMRQILASHASLLGDISDNYKHSENNLSQQWGDVKIGR